VARKRLGCPCHKPVAETTPFGWASDMQSQYFSNVLLAGLYFCDKTKVAIRNLHDTKQNWWEINTVMRDALVNAMVSELSCGIADIHIN
jgi:hypothetical protein